MEHSGETNTACEHADRQALEPFEREERFIVIKRKHLTPFMEGAIRNQLAALEVPTVECVVIESDWPEYDAAWKMIEDRVTGRALASRPDAGEALADRIDAILKAGNDKALSAPDGLRTAILAQTIGELRMVLASIKSRDNPAQGEE